ncbi:MAG: cation transporter, partial [Pseudomonadota bacterium]
RAFASLFKGASLALIAIAVLGMTALRVLDGSPPEAGTMGLVGFMALAANAASVVILLRWRDGDSNVRSVWLCSRNDAIGNVGVILAGGLVALTGSAWPDLVVAVLLASLFLKSASTITLQATREIKADRETQSPRTPAAS